MSLPPILPLHPADVFFGICVPEVQSYAVALPRAGLRLDALRERLAALVVGRFGRFAYRMPATLGVVTTLRLDGDPASPATAIARPGLEALDAAALCAAPGERHWHLFAVEDEDLCVLLLVFDHLLCHGQAARAFLFALADALRDGPGGPPALEAAARERFLSLQAHLTARFHAPAPWADHRRLSFPAARVQRLARALEQPFTEATALWLGRSVLDVSPRAWPVDVSIFRMARDAGDGVDPAVGNRGLQLDTWEILPGGGYARTPSEAAGDPAGVERFVRFYERFPWKWPLAWAMRAAIASARRRGPEPERERLVLNNLGATPWPFFRTMFFDPANDQDRFGLCFVDGVEDRVELQLAPARRFLAGFDLPAFEARLAENLDAMVADPRVRPIPA